MSSSSLTAAFPDRSGAIVSSFFSSTDVTEKTWSSVKLLAESDDVTFWTVFSHHQRLASALGNLINAVDVAHSSSSAAQRRVAKKEYERGLCIIVIRLATASGLCTAEKGVLPEDFARRLDVVLPLSTLFPIATMLFRRSGATASMVLTSLFLLNPSYLCRLPLHLTNWFDHVNRLATRCQAEMQRGRYQRLSGDVLPLFEQTYRTTKHLWALVQSAPFVADYVPLTRTLRTLRVIADVLSPILQHFLMTCEALNTRRDILSKANAMIVNTAVNASSALVLFHTFNTPKGGRHWAVPRIPQSVYESLAGFMSQYVSGIPTLLLNSLGKGRSLQTLCHQLSPPLEDADDGQIGKVILSLFETISDSKDFADLLLAARERFGEVLLLELVQQGLSIDALLSGQFVTSTEAKKLGASEDIIARAMAGLPVEDGGSDEPQLPSTNASPGSTTNTASPKAAVDDPNIGKDPLVDMVAEVFPHFNRHGIRAALNYYNNDPEQFILDASMENIPPHLLSQLKATSSAEAAESAEVPAQVAANAALAEALEVSNGAKSAGKSQHLTNDDFTNELGEADLHLYLGSDLYELVTSSYRDDASDGGAGDQDDRYQDYSSYRKDAEEDFFGGTAAGGAGAFGGGIDDDMREKIRMLTEMMYDDELDDGQMDEVRMANAGTDTDEDGEGDAGEYSPTKRHRNNNNRNPTAHSTSVAPSEGVPTSEAAEGSNESKTRPGAPPARSEYEKKQFRARIARERSKNMKDKNAQKDEQVPAYAKKQKTAKHAKGGGGGKDALTRAFKKGAF